MKFTTQLNAFRDNRVTNYLSDNANALGNHLIVIMAFFSVINPGPYSGAYTYLLILFLFKPNKMDKLKEVFTNKVVQAILLFVSMSVVWVYVADDVSLAKPAKENYVYLLHVVGILLFLEYKYVHKVIAAFILGVFVNELLSYAIAFGWISHPFVFSFEGSRLDNPTPFMYHIIYGFVLAVTGTLLAQLYSEKKSKWVKFSVALFFISISTNLVLNIGRTGYVLFVIGLILLVFLKYKKNVFKLVLVMVLFFTFLFYTAYNFSPQFKVRIDQTVVSVNKIIDDNNYGSSIGMRFLQVKQGYQLFLERPIWGYGTGQNIKVMYQDAVDKKLSYARSIKNFFTNDNLYLDITLQFGLVGLILYLNIFYQTMRYQQPVIYLKHFQLIVVVLYLLYGLQSGLIIPALALLLAIPLVKKKQDEEVILLSWRTYALYGVGILFFGLRTYFSWKFI